MNDAIKWVRPWFMSLAALFGLIVMVWGLIAGAMGAFHIAQPKYGRAQSDQGDVAAAFRSVYSPLLSLGASQGDVPPGSDEALARAEDSARLAALDRAKDQAYNDTVKGALAFVVGGFVLGIGASGAKRAARGNAGNQPVARSAPAMASPGPAPRPAPPQPSSAPPARTGAPSRMPPPRPAAPPPATRAVPVPPRPAGTSQATTSPVGALQEAPKRSRRAAPAAPRRAARKENEAAPARPAPVPAAQPAPPPPPPPPAPAPDPPPARPATAPTFRPPSAPPPTTGFSPPPAPGTPAPRSTDEEPAPPSGEEEPGT